MTSAKITRCKHYFHGVCLRKWLYVQDKCPLCHEVVINQDKQAIVVEPINPVEPINLNLNVDDRNTPSRSTVSVEPDLVLERALNFDGGGVRNSRASSDSDSNESNYTSNSEENNLNFNSRSSPSRHFVNNFN